MKRRVVGLGLSLMMVLAVALPGTAMAHGRPAHFDCNVTVWEGKTIVASYAFESHRDLSRTAEAGPYTIDVACEEQA